MGTGVCLYIKERGQNEVSPGMGADNGGTDAGDKVEKMKEISRMLHCRYLSCRSPRTQGRQKETGDATMRDEGWGIHHEPNVFSPE